MNDHYMPCQNVSYDLKACIPYPACVRVKEIGQILDIKKSLLNPQLLVYYWDYVVNNTGNPWVSGMLPVLIPAPYPYPYYPQDSPGVFQGYLYPNPSLPVEQVLPGN